MAFKDICFQSGEGQDFLVELPSVVYTGAFDDILIEAGGSQNLILEIPQVTGGGSNIFIMSE